MDMCDVLLLEADWEVGRLVRRSLESHGLKVQTAVCPPAACEHNFVAVASAAARSCGARMVIPIFYPELIARHPDLFPDCIIPLSPAPVLEMLDDKVSFLAFARKTLSSTHSAEARLLQTRPPKPCGSVPPSSAEGGKSCGAASSVCVGESTEILFPKEYESVEAVDRYPVVFKRASGHGGDSVYFPKKRESLEHLVGNSLPGAYLITEEIDGADVSVDALRWPLSANVSGGEGDDVFFCAGAYEVLLPRAKGVSLLRESIDAPGLIDCARRLLDACDFRGVCGFDFRIPFAPDGSLDYSRAYLLECNPRFSGGLASDIASGLDLPWLLWQLATDSTGLKGGRGCSQFLPGLGSTEQSEGDFGKTPIAFQPKIGVRTGSRAGLRDYLRRRIHSRKLSFRDLRLVLFSRLRLRDDI